MIYHGDEHKRKKTGGKKKPAHKKRKYYMGDYPTNTRVGERSVKVKRTRGGNRKYKLRSDKFANVYVPDEKKVVRVEILRLEDNPAGAYLKRRGIITKGAIIETEMGLARVTNRPGQEAQINAVLIQKKE